MPAGVESSAAGQQPASRALVLFLDLNDGFRYPGPAK